MKILFAYFALLAFLPFALMVFRRLPKAQAAATVVIVGSLFLPQRLVIDLPAIPPMDKEYITYLSTLIAAIVFRRSSIVRARPGTGLELVVLLMVFANIATAQMNSHPMMDEGRMEDGLSLYWIFARSTDDFLTVAVPFFVGRALFTSLNDLYVFMRTLVIAAFCYTGLIAIELLMSIPFRVWHLSQLVYDLPPRINFRWGMTQPAVFLENGLALATFMAMAVIASAALVKAKLPIPRFGKRFGLPGFSARFLRSVLTVGLMMTLNVAGIVYGTSFLLAHVFGRRKLITALGVSLAILACVYPALRIADVFPYEVIVDFAREYDPDRARSLEGRFFEEEHVLSKIGDRLWLGWGTYSRIPGAETFGEGEVGLDGWVTIRLGVSGILGVALYYMVFAIPVFRAWGHIARAKSTTGILLGALVCMISVRMIDLIINGWWNCLPIFLAGVLAGVSGNLNRGGRRVRSGSRVSASSTSNDAPRAGSLLLESPAIGRTPA